MPDPVSMICRRTWPAAVVFPRDFQIASAIGGDILHRLQAISDEIDQYLLNCDAIGPYQRQILIELDVHRG